MIILFDLDGTLVDTIDDLALSMSHVLKTHPSNKITENNLPPPEDISKKLRSSVSYGLQAMLNCYYPEHTKEEKDILNQTFTEYYRANIAQKSKLFVGMDKLLDYLDQNKITWGIVTNKRELFAKPLLQNLNLYDRATCIVYGDTLPVKKPDPKPLIYACKLANKNPEQGWYIGDSEIDMQAGKAANMQTILVLHGYIGEYNLISNWPADHTISNPIEIQDIINGR